MKSRFLSGFTLAAVFAVFSSPVFADISAQEVRDALVGYYESFGYQVDIGSEETSDGSIALNNMTLSMELPDGDGQVTVVLESIGFAETGDGAVSIEMPENVKNEIRFEKDSRPPVSAVLNTSLPAFQGTVSGSIDNMTIQTSGDGMTFAVNNLSFGDEDIPVKLIMQGGPFTSEYTLESTADNRRDLAGASAMQGLEILANIKEPGGPGFFTLKASLTDLTSTFGANLADVSDPMALLAAGLEVATNIETGAFALDVAFKDRSKHFSGKIGIEDQRFAFSLSPDEISYDLAERGVSVSVSSSEIPFPTVEFAYDELGIAFGVPLSHAAEPRDYHASVALRGLSVSEMIWAMVDPAQTLPRDPATVAVDLSGKVMVLTDLMNPETLANLDHMDVPPMLPVSVVLNELTATVAGALLSGEGSFEFNFQNPNMVGGVPLPVGKATLSLDGGYSLLDNLSALGLVPEEAAMGVRAMLGAFARPVGEDQFETVIELTEEGTVTANGQKIK
ncbi:MAG: hypothetical protein ACE5DK_02010 [Paracoccaceae bacterium]